MSNKNAVYALVGMAAIGVSVAVIATDTLQNRSAANWVGEQLSVSMVDHDSDNYDKESLDQSPPKNTFEEVASSEEAISPISVSYTAVESFVKDKYKALASVLTEADDE